MTMLDIASAVEISRALGHPARLRTVAMLRTGELCVCQITEVLRLAQSTVSGHLRELRRAGLITERKDGRWVYVALSEDPEAGPWLDAALAAATGDRQAVADDLVVEELRGLPVEDLCRFGYEHAKAKASSNEPGQMDRQGQGGRR
jgi:DNA-binding transcriptional ArsR family regulator